MAVTVIEAGPCVVIQDKGRVRSRDGSISWVFCRPNPRRSISRWQGHFKKHGLDPQTHLKEFPAAGRFRPTKWVMKSRVDIFQIGEKVKVQGMSKGKGFAGVVKRWGFSGGKDTHGCTSHRVPGSIGSSAYPSRVLKGKKMPGHMGHRRVSQPTCRLWIFGRNKICCLSKGPSPGAATILWPSINNKTE